MVEEDPRGLTQHPGTHLVTSTVLNPSSLEFKNEEPRGSRYRKSRSQKDKLEGLLRKERVKECYQLGLQVSDQSGRPVSHEDKRQMKKKALKLARYASDRHEDLCGMGAHTIAREKRLEEEQRRAPSRGMITARSALNHFNVLRRFREVRDRRKSQPEPLQWMHNSEGAMHSREVFKEREREVGLRNDRPITAQPNSQGCSTTQAAAMVREKLRVMLMNNTGAVRKVFSEFDKDGDGVLNTKEFHEALHALGLPLAEHESLKFMQRFLDGSSGKKSQMIDFHDFFTKVLGLPHDMSRAGPKIGAKPAKHQNPTEKVRMTPDEARRWFLAQIRLQVLNVPHCLSRVFNVMDPDHSGTIDTEELREGLRKIGLWLKEDELRQLFAIYDEDQSGAIDYQEFIAEILGIPSVKQMRKKQRASLKGADTGSDRLSDATGSEAAGEEKGTIRARELQCIIRQKLERAIADPGHLREVFSRMDQDGSGVITYEDFSACCDSFGMIITPETKSKLFTELDAGGSGFLTYSDFINHVALVPHDIVDIPHPQAPEARVSTPQVLDELRDRIKERVMCQREPIEKLFLAFNKDRRKTISYGGFHNTLSQLGLPLKDHHIGALWKQWGGVRSGKLQLRDFVDQILEFSLDKPGLSSTPITGFPAGTPMPDPVPKLVPAFECGRASVQAGEPHYTINSTRKPVLSMTPFGDARDRPSTAPQQKRRSSSRGVQSARSAWTPQSAVPGNQILPQSMMSKRQYPQERPSSQNSFRSLGSLRSNVTPRVGSAELHWKSSSKITA